MKKTLLFFFILAALCMQARNREVRLRFIATSDIHGNYLPYDYISQQPGKGGLSRVYTYVKLQRKQLGEEPVVLLDNGDILQGQPTAYYYNFIDTISTHFCAQALNYMRYDAATIGNHDIETGHAVYDRWVGECKFPMLGANVVDTSTGKPYWKPYTIIERNGIRIGVIGMVTPSIPKWLPNNLWAGLRFDDLVETARRWLPEMRYKEHADIIVGLFHSGTGVKNARGRMHENAALQVARMVPGFDIIFCGHDHREANLRISNVRGDSVLVLNPGANGMSVAQADIRLTLKKGAVAGKWVSGRLINVADLQPAPDFVNRFSSQAKAVETFVGEKVGENETELSTRGAYFGSTPFTDFIHELQMRIGKADISFCAPLAFDVRIPKGEIHVSDMFNLYKYENQLYVMQLTGEEIKNYLEYSYGGWTVQMTSPADHLLRFRKDAETLPDAWQRLYRPSYNFDSAAGIIYTVDVTKPTGEKISIKSMADGTPFDLKHTYRVAVNSYRGGGGGDLLTKGAGINKADLVKRIVWATDKDLRYYLIQEIRQQGTIRPRALKQWKFIPEDWAEQAAKRDSIILFR